jgi:asparagine synthase (glutamine-hydrolysing)
MCGICGILLNSDREKVDPEQLRRMCSIMSHRGPDDEGYYISGSVGLGMRRLSIIDLASGYQPIHNEDLTIQVVFNGEIYNYRELRSILESRGHSFYTNSDTEVIVHAYEEYGGDCLNKFRGMFALALWDARDQSALLAVDRFGIKPLYYAANEQGIIFGSELKSLLASGMSERDIDFDALAQYFTVGYIAAPASIYRQVRKLSPGHFLSWKPFSDPVIQQYWDVPNQFGMECQQSLQEIRIRLRELLGDAVRSHLVSDVPIGAFLSGGIDSSTVVALMSEVSSEPVKTFSIGFANWKHNELDKARSVAQRFSTDHHEFIVEPENVDILPNLVHFFDEPFSDSSALPTFYVSKIARQFVKVALSGDGGDELFIGYTLFRGLQLSHHLKLLPIPLLRLFRTFPHMLPRTRNVEWNDFISRLIKRINDSSLPPDEAYQSKITKAGLSLVGPLLSKDFQQRLIGNNPFKGINELLARYPSQKGSHALDKFVYACLKVSLPGDMLVKVDRMSMANSLEVRVPLLDHIVAEYISSIPIKVRFPQWRLKGLLKDTMADILPAEILNQRKQGFDMPISSWFRGDLAGFASDVLLSQKAQQRGHLNAPAVAEKLRQHRKGDQNFGATLWSLLIYELWCQGTMDRNS